MTGPRPHLVALATLVALAAPAVAQEAAPTIQEWNVPWARTRPRDPYLDRQGRVWFVGQTGQYVGVLDPATGEFKKFDLAPRTGPHNLILDSTGIVWYGNGIGKLTVATGQVRVVPLPTPRARPYGIKVDRTGRPWIVLFGTNKLATVDPQTFALTEYPLPRAATRPRRLEITSDGAVWYCDYAGGMLGRFDPRTQKVEEWPLPGGPTSRPYATALDDRGRIWIVETGSQPNRLIGFDTHTRQFLPGADVPSGGGTVRHMVFDVRTRVIWFGTDANTIGRAQLPNPPAAAVP
jgi:virginiamycin B lyase